MKMVQARNPGLGRRGYEKAFRDYFGVRETIWLHRGIVGDDTHGHVDDLARFTDERTVVTAVERDKSDANYDLLRENLGLLKARKDLRIVTLPMPEPVIFAGQRLPASYANFYIANGLVLVPDVHGQERRSRAEHHSEVVSEIVKWSGFRAGTWCWV